MSNDNQQPRRIVSFDELVNNNGNMGIDEILATGEGYTPDQMRIRESLINARAVSNQERLIIAVERLADIMEGRPKDAT